MVDTGSIACRAYTSQCKPRQSFRLKLCITRNSHQPKYCQSVGLINMLYRDSLKGLYNGQKCLQLFSESEAYHEQMGPIPSSNESLDIAPSNLHTYSPRRRNFQTVDATELASR